MQSLNGKITGGTLTAAEWNELPTEIQNVITGLGITLSGGDLNQLGKAIAGYSANGTFYTDSGTANAYVLTTIGSKQSPTAFVDGMVVEFVAGNDNSGASTVNPAGLGVKSIKSKGGNALGAGEITGRVRCVYDSVNGWFELVTLTTGLGRKNSIINSRFRVNQRVVSGTVSLSAGEYGHDRFRGGSAGATYTFSTSGGVTTINISAGTIEQEIEANNINAGSNVLSWSGTAQGRIDAGSYGDTGEVTASLTGSATVTCEWDTGTLSLCQLELGTSATISEFVTVEQELVECRRYFWAMLDEGVSILGARKVNASSAAAVTTSTFSISAVMPEMRAVPTMTDVIAADVTLNGESGSLIATCTAIPLVSLQDRAQLSCTFASADVTDVTHIRFANGAPSFDAEL